MLVRHVELERGGTIIREQGPTLALTVFAEVAPC
jgi:hypothetical protein